MVNVNERRVEKPTRHLYEKFFQMKKQIKQNLLRLIGFNAFLYCMFVFRKLSILGSNISIYGLLKIYGKLMRNSQTKPA